MVIAKPGTKQRLVILVRIFLSLFYSSFNKVMGNPSPLSNADSVPYLETEVLTMRYLKKKGLPVAEVYAFDTSPSNPLKCPFILMEHLPGRPLYEGKYYLIAHRSLPSFVHNECSVNRPSSSSILRKLWLTVSRF